MIMIKKALALVVATLFIPVFLFADIIYFKDGRKVVTKNAWVDENSVKCERFGGVVSYPKSQVDRIEMEIDPLNASERPKPKAVPPKDSPDNFMNQYGMTFVYIEPGTFMMGSPENEIRRLDWEVRRKVTITRGFYMQTTEMTQGQWKAIMGENPSHFKNCGADCPVENVSWLDVKAFVNKLNSRGEGTYRLPTEAQWEYACRAGTDTPFSFGNCLSTDQANYKGTHPLPGCPKGENRKRTVAVGSFPANDWGLYDMHGNVVEWCMNRLERYSSDPVTDPQGPSKGTNRMYRGGAWSGVGRNCRS
ncbi:MAG: formylglycine-generating enzyme family protein, partial [bacterium]|nr:formylglycine-generating enzyme family protein [bacterium]